MAAASFVAQMGQALGMNAASSAGASAGGGIADALFGGISICDMQLSHGNKSVDWTPAPEDVDSSISTAQQAAQTYATTNCVQVGLSNAPDAIKNQVLAAAHGNFTYIDGASVYTGTLNANQVTVGYISADRIAANSLDASKIIANSITSTHHARARNV